MNFQRYEMQVEHDSKHWPTRKDQMSQVSPVLCLAVVNKLAAADN